MISGASLLDALEVTVDFVAEALSTAGDVEAEREEAERLVAQHWATKELSGRVQFLKALRGSDT